MKYSIILLFLIIPSYEMSSEIQSPLKLALNDSCQFTHNFTSESFEYRCEIGSFDEQCSLPDDVVKPNFNAVTQLKIVTCPLNTVQNLYGKYANLQSLDLSNSGYNSLNSLELNHEHLVKVNLSHNDLTEIPKNLFENSSKLKEIDISYNQLKTISEDIFKNVSQIEKIHLSHNKIISIDDDTFSGLINLKFLDLNSNSLDYEIPVFYKNPNLTELHLENNGMTSVDCDFFLIRRCIVYISWGNVKLLETKCARVEIDVVLDGQFEGISSINPEKFELHFSKQDLSSLKRFEAGENQVKNVTKLISALKLSPLEELHLSGNFIGQLKTETFRNFTDLSGLSLRDTNLSAFNFNPFEQLTKFTSLDISHNNLENQDFELLSSTLKHLMTFYCANCHIRNAKFVINALGPEIRFLDLSGNFIGEIDTIMSQHFYNLFSLNLARTNLMHFNFDTNIRHLQSLNISGNNLKVLIFPSWNNDIFKLFLDGNDLKEMRNFQRTHFSKLTKLTIGQNQFSCEYLAGLKREWNDTEIAQPWLKSQPNWNDLIGVDSLNQKRGGCINGSNTMPIELEDSSNAVIYSIAIGTSIVFVTTISSVCFILRKKLFKKSHQNNHIEHEIPEYEEIKFEYMPSRHRTEVSSDDSSSEHIYEEINPPPIIYDHLRFQFDPLPVPTEDDHYQHIGARRNS